jgi:hypothetical protein
MRVVLKQFQKIAESNATTATIAKNRKENDNEEKIRGGDTM